MFLIQNGGTYDYRNELKLLWKQCFGDEDEYINQVFINQYRPLRTYIALDDDKPVGALQFTKYEFVRNNTKYLGVYIFGVCVNEEYRHRGIATLLINDLVKRMSAEAHSFYFLISAADELYEKLGFVPITSKYEHPTTPGACDGINEMPLDATDMLDIYNNVINDACLVRDDHIASCMISLYGKDAVAFVKDGTTLGYALKEGNEFAEELIGINDDALTQVQAYLNKTYPNMVIRNGEPSINEVRQVYVLPIGDFDINLLKDAYISPEI